MHKKLISLSIILFVGCTVLQEHRKIKPVGMYVNFTQVSSAFLRIKPDSTFTYERISAGLRSEYKGKWEVINKRELLLNCNTTMNYTSALDSFLFPPLNLIDVKLVLLNNNKVKLNDVVLKKHQKQSD